MHNNLTWLKDLAKEFIFALITALLITQFVFTLPLVPSGSMIPTIKIGERVLVDKLTTWFVPVQRGEIVIFPCPDAPHEDYIKRVIGLPGETVLIREGNVYIDDVVLDEPYLVEDTRGTFGPYYVPEGHIFVMGDNRNTSADSRYWRSTPYVDLKDVSGRGRAIIWPLGSIRSLH